MFDPLTTTAAQLQQLLKDGEISSIQIVERYIAQIERYNTKLNAFISIAPRDNMLGIAAALDGERQRGQIRSPLHGIPIVLKDCFVTEQSLGMDTTAGSCAFVGAKAKRNGAVVQRLIDAGLIVLGKTNMTEFCGMKMINSPGLSAVAGQTISPYVGEIEQNETILGHSNPGGSSTGSAVALAAGFIPLALGSETIGSLVTPTARAALYTIKPTVGAQDPAGMYRMTDYFDSPGPMAKSASDLAALLEIMLGRSFGVTGDWDELSIGFLSPSVWKLGEAMCRQHEGTAEQMIQDYEKMVSLLKDQDCHVKYPIELPDPQILTVDDQDAIMPIAFWEFKHVGIPGFIDAFEECAVQDLASLTKFNEDNKEKELYSPPLTDQDLMLKAQESPETAEKIQYLRDGLKKKARQIVDKVFEDEGVDLIAAPADSALATYAAAAGYISACVPLGQLTYNKRPFGLCLLAKAHHEETCLRFMAAYEAATAPRPVPEL